MQHSRHTEKNRYVGLSTDAWTTTAQRFITVTAHVTDKEFNLLAYALDTTEIKVRHTSDNLLAHLRNAL